MLADEQEDDEDRMIREAGERLAAKRNASAVQGFVE